MSSKEFYMVGLFGQATVAFSRHNVERRTKMTFAKNLMSCTCKTCWILWRLLSTLNRIALLIKCIRLNCILMPIRYSEARRCYPKHYYRTTRGRRVPECSCCARYNVHQSTISRLWQHYQQSCSTNASSGSGRPRITNPVQNRYFRVFQLRNRTITASQTASNIPDLRRISARTVRNRLREHGMRARRPYFGAVLIVEQGWDCVTHSGYWIWQIGEESGSAMNQGSCLNDKMVELASIDAVMNDLLQIVSSRLTIMAKEVYIFCVMVWGAYILCQGSTVSAISG